MYRRFKLLILVLGLISVFSCEEELKPMPFTFTKFFTGATSKTWKVSFFEETLNGTVTDNFLPGCIADDQFKFYANAEHLYETTSGTNKCFEDEAGLTSSSWSYTTNNATLIMLLPIFSSDPLPFFVRKVNKDDLQIEIFLDDKNTASYRIHLKVIDEE
ncbi:MAG: hypothetical protein ABIS36_26565 [Chryseolinea sp.]